VKNVRAPYKAGNLVASCAVSCCSVRTALHKIGEEIVSSVALACSLVFCAFAISYQSTSADDFIITALRLFWQALL
jgi:hypothetical protein